MRCSICGMDIPVAGSACPFCDDAKRLDQARLMREHEKSQRQRFESLVTFLVWLLVVLALVYLFGSKWSRGGTG